MFNTLLLDGRRIFVVPYYGDQDQRFTICGYVAGASVVCVESALEVPSKSDDVVAKAGQLVAEMMPLVRTVSMQGERLSSDGEGRRLLWIQGDALVPDSGRLDATTVAQLFGLVLGARNLALRTFPGDLVSQPPEATDITLLRIAGFDIDPVLDPAAKGADQK
jgi:hypothetical protein